MTNATGTPAAAAPVDEKKAEKEPEKESETATPEEPELENEKNGNGHTEVEGNRDAEEINGPADDDKEDKTDANDKAENGVEEKEGNPLKRKELPLDAEDDCLKKQKVIDAEEKEVDSPAAVEA